MGGGPRIALRLHASRAASALRCGASRPTGRLRCTCRHALSHVRLTEGGRGQALSDGQRWDTCAVPTNQGCTCKSNFMSKGKVPRPARAAHLPLLRAE
jgi:hypothetical protein